MSRQLRFSLVILSLVTGQLALAEPLEVYCTIRSNGANLNCQVLGRERKVMNAEDISNFIDAGEVAAYVTLKSRKGLERTFMVDGRSPQYKRLNDVKKSASISEINKAKSDLFNEIEKKVIKLSDELDGQAATAELVLYDPSIAYEKAKRDSRTMNAELEAYRKNKDKNCSSTPAFDQVSKTNAKLQQTLSNILYAFQSPDTCMSDYKVFKDRDGSVDLRQLDTVSDFFKSNCRKK
jgi:hypothetical protein